MRETFEILKGQMKLLEEMTKSYKSEPELQIKITEAMVQVATVMADIAKKVLYEEL